MKILQNLALAAAFTLGAASLSYAQPASSPAGYIISEANCASGGQDLYFFADKTVISVWEGAEYQPYVQVGKWYQSGSVINVHFTVAYYGEGVGSPSSVSAINHYDEYKAMKRSVDESDGFEWDNSLEDGCTEVRKHKASNDFRTFLRTGTTDIYPFTKERLVTESELQKYSKDQLRTMRNEIFARYGYAFKTKDMQTKFPGGFLSDVNAFMSEIEVKNVDIIKKVENSK